MVKVKMALFQFQWQNGKTGNGDDRKYAEAFGVVQQLIDKRPNNQITRANQSSSSRRLLKLFAVMTNTLECLGV